MSMTTRNRLPNFTILQNNRPLSRARVHGLEVGDDVYAGDPATTRLANPATQFREALAYGVGLNWHANQNVKAYLSLEQTRFRKGDGNRDNELVLFTRTQFSF